MLIVTGYDGSPQAERAVRKADELAATLGAEHHILMVAHLSAYSVATASMPSSYDIYAYEEEFLQESVKELQDTLSVEPKVTLTRGHPSHELSKYAMDHGADLLVVGSRGRGAVRTMLMGSTSHGVLWQHPCDVLVVRGPEDGEEPAE